MNHTPPVPRTTRSFELPRGTAVGKYEIVRKLATGGMAEIYLARSRGTAGFEKFVVLKRILPHVADDPTFVQMFLDEARLAATLQHPNIADVHDVGESDGTYFFTMEFVHGQDVRAICSAERQRGQHVPLGIALALVHGTAAALHHAHEKRGSDGRPLGLVHRDVSSSNVLVSYDGAVKLVDFGIARASGPDRETRTGALNGKISYMSPEQVQGIELDRRADLWSLGVLLYELTVGERPFRGDTDFAILEQIVHGGARRPSQLVSGYPPELEGIVMRLLERDVALRYASGEQVVHALEQVVAQRRWWVSQIAIGKYMRALFADRIAAWEAATPTPTPSPIVDLDAPTEIAEFAGEEATLVEPIIDATSGGLAASAELPPPPIVVPPLVVAPVVPPVVVAPVAPPRGAAAPVPPAAPPPIALAPPRRSPRWTWIAAATAVTIGGAIGGYLLVVATSPPPPATPTAPTAPAPRSAPAPTPSPAAPSPVRQDRTAAPAPVATPALAPDSRAVPAPKHAPHPSSATKTGP